MAQITDIHNLIDQLIREDEKGMPYCYMTNSDGKEWLFYGGSGSSIKQGLNIYEPMSAKGKMIKGALPFVHKLLCSCGVLGFASKRIIPSPELQEIITKAFGVSESDLRLNYFLGTPCVHQKIVIQVSTKDSILGYVKVSDREEVIKGFYKEAGVLESLHEKGVSNVPKSLFCGPLGPDSEIVLFVQNSQKRPGCYSDTTLNRYMLEFVEDLNRATKRTVQFEESDFCRSLADIEKNICFYPGDGSKLLDIVHGVQEELRGRSVEFSVYHGDLTPWNSYINIDDSGHKSFHAFDLEYARETYPPYLDIFHWFMSVCIFEKHLGAEEIAREFEQNYNIIRGVAEDGRQLFRYYLLAQISLYLGREREQLSGDLKRNMLIWAELLGK